MQLIDVKNKAENGTVTVSQSSQAATLTIDRRPKTEALHRYNVVKVTEKKVKNEKRQKY